MEETTVKEKKASSATWEHLEPFVRAKVQELIQQLLEQEVTEHLGRVRYARREGDDVGYRNGYGKARRLAMQGGTMAKPAGAAATSAATSNNGKKKPNILIIWGDDIGWFNPSCYNSGIMGYRTPNIDRIAAEGARFTDWYGQQSPGAPMSESRGSEVASV